MRNFPKIYTEKHFLYLLDVKKKNFVELVNNKKLYYKKSKKLKSDGIREREIYEPVWDLKIILRKISRRYLLKLDYPSFIHCGPEGRSILTAAKGHKYYIYHVSLDIDSFFDKVSKEVVSTTLKHVGIEPAIANLIIDIAVEDNKLPQGFPTSSHLSALVVSKVLEDFYHTFDRKNIILSLYADDILLSSNDRSLIEQAEKFIAERIDSVGLSLNEKREEGRKGSRFIWLGLQIHPWVSIPREKLKELQKSIYEYKVNGVIPKDFKPKKKGRLKKKWEESLMGKVVFIKSVNKNKLIDKIAKKLN